MPKAPRSDTLRASLTFTPLCELGLQCEYTCMEIKDDELVEMSEPRTPKECADSGVSLLLYNDEALTRNIVAAQCPTEGEYLYIQEAAAAEGATANA
jgi:hypothetical protein